MFARLVAFHQGVVIPCASFVLFAAIYFPLVGLARLLRGPGRADPGSSAWTDVEADKRPERLY